MYVSVLFRRPLPSVVGGGRILRAPVLPAARLQFPRPSLPPFRVGRWLLSYDEAELEKACAAMYRELVEQLEQGASAAAVGLDIEWKPRYSKRDYQEHGDARTALVQVATPSMCILAPLHHVAPPPALAALLADERIFKLGVGVADDGRKLQKDWNLRCSPTFEVGRVAAQLQQRGQVRFPFGPRRLASPIGLKRLAEACGALLPEKRKNISRSNWERRPLSRAQQLYAGQDAYVSLWTGARLHELHVGASAATSSAGQARTTTAAGSGGRGGRGGRGLGARRTRGPSAAAVGSSSSSTGRSPTLVEWLAAQSRAGAG